MTDRQENDDEVFCCKFCGRQTFIDPSDQCPPADYCSTDGELEFCIG